MRSLVRTALVAGLTGSLALGSAWAGVSFTPAPTVPTGAVAVPALPGAALPGGTAAPGAAAPGTSGPSVVTAAAGTPALGSGQLLVGAAKTSIAPDPERMRTRGFPTARWERNPVQCKTLAPEYLQRLLSQTQVELDHLASAGSAWPENPDCLYMGGFGLGPVNPISAFDTEYGLWVRSLAFSDGDQTMVLTVVDGEGWLWDYADKCDDCGSKQIAQALAADPALAAKGVTPASFVLAATHSHASPDFIGGWGFVPDWYLRQVTDTVKATAKAAVEQMVPAVIETGEIEAREENGERRDTYRSAEEQQLSYLRAVAVQQTRSASKGRSGPRSDEAPRVIATLGAYAAHPTTKGTNGGVAHPDWPGLFERRLEDRFGGIGLHFMTGLGNMSASGGTTIGTRLADLLPAVGQGRMVTSTDLRLAQTTWQQPVTNVPLTALGLPGFFDRQFDQQPATVTTGKSPDTAPCTSASQVSVELPVTAVAIGTDVVLTTAPGEIFSNVSNTIKEKSAGRITFPLAQANDALGYMPQSFELNPVGQQGLGFVAGGAVFVNYEDSYAVDRCVGDKVLETTLALVAGLH